MNKKQNQGIDANNQQFSQYDQVNKSQVYQLSEQVDSEDFDEEFEIKSCDMSGLLSGDATEAEIFSKQLGAALEEIGFAVLTGHGVDPDLYRQATDKVIDFFESTSQEERQPYLAKRQGSVNQGYFPKKETTIIHPDLVEGWVFCRRAFNMDNNPDYNEKEYWPRVGYEPFFRQICLAHEALIKPIMQSVLSYLNVNPHCYDEKLTRTNFGFRLNYYPVLTDEDLGTGSGRMLGHEDVDLFTILPAQNVDGLQVLNRQNMKWIRLNAPAGSIVLNTGDYMQRITNDRLPSTTHRVSRPRTSKGLHIPRVSIPMAVYVWEHETLEVLPGLSQPKYSSINAEQFHTRITSKYYGDDYTIEES